MLGVALPLFMLVEWPVAGWLFAAAAWFIQAVVVTQMEQRAIRASEPRHQVGLVVGASLLRAWIAAAAILAAYLAAGNAAGLACALLVVALFTIYFANKLFVHFTQTAGEGR